MAQSSYDLSSILLDKRLVHISPTLVLVPYLPHHVPKYHGWMSNEAILQQTASEALSLEEEYQMQINWALDADKRTCILIPRADLHKALIQQLTENDGKLVLDDASLVDPAFGELILDRTHHLTRAQCVICHKTDAKGVYLDHENQYFCCQLCEARAACGDIGVEVAVGDVNLFLHDYLQDDNEGKDDANQCVGVDDDLQKSMPPVVAEVEIMIAEHSARRSGFGQTAMKLMTQYAIEWLNIKRFIAKINNDNIPSLSMFQNKLDYTVYATVECFDEVHLDWHLDKAGDSYPFFPISRLPPHGYSDILAANNNKDTVSNPSNNAPSV